MERVNRLVQGWTTYIFPSRLDFLLFSSSPIITTTTTTTAFEAWRLAIRREQAARAVERAFVRGFAALST